MWVAMVPCYVSSLLTIPVLGPAESECQWCLAIYPACWQCLYLSLQRVSDVSYGFSSLLTNPVLGSSGSEWLSCLAVFFSQLTMPVLDSLGSEWLWCLAVFVACWQCLSLAVQYVSDCTVLLCLWPADNACPWLFSMWVTVLLCF